MKTSAAFADNEKRTDEFCLSATTNSQYTFKLLDTGGNSWSAGSWVSAAGIYGNTVLKTFMTDNGEENYALSLYYPVMKTAEWKTTSASSTIASDWNSQSFTETDWNTVTLGSASAVAGTQYFRKAFNGIPSMAAYELELNYKFGTLLTSTVWRCSATIWPMATPLPPLSVLEATKPTTIAA